MFPGMIVFLLRYVPSGSNRRFLVFRPNLDELLIVGTGHVAVFPIRSLSPDVAVSNVEQKGCCG